MKLAFVVETQSGVPIAAATDAADVSEVVLGPAALAGVPIAWDTRPETPVLADRAYDSDPLREDFAVRGYRLISPHRKNRTKPSSNDGRRMRRYRRRYKVERAFAWVQSFRRVATRYEWYCDLYDGFVSLACALIALGKL
jgi:transposase